MPDDQTGSSSAVAERAPARLDKLPPWNVLLHNDDHSEMGHVVDSIIEFTPHPRQRAIELMLTAHTRGLVLVMTTHKEHAELVQDRFRSKSLSCTIEPAPGA